MDADIATIAALRERHGADLPVVTVGFCFGGSHSWRQSGGDLGLAGCAGFYGPSPDARPRLSRPGNRSAQPR
ncbi:dienelactone hydrolase family protein [Blastococcus sp. TML/C7B]|uniref:dienelactone hydrolase family protein n=1 Tax=Blastococcus sp. TML/C7B TaxID=2798728 RepID=UPI0035C8FF22